MARNVYNAPAMKRGAEAIEKELRKFEANRKEAEEIINKLHYNWDDDESQKYTRKYKREVEPVAKELSQMMQQFASILKQCSKKYGSAIDNGNSRLSI